MARADILLVEDEAGTRELLQMYLEKNGHHVYSVERGEQGLAIVREKHVQIALLDIELPGMDGVAVCRAIREEMMMPILFISCRQGVMDKITCLEAGGDDYLTKPFDFSELEVRIQANLRRYTEYSERKKTAADWIVHGDLRINPQRALCYLRDEIVELSAKEWQLLLLLVRHPNRIWETEQIYDQIWGVDSIGDVGTVKVHIRHLRRKLEDNPSNPTHIQTIRGFGYTFTP